MQNIISIESLNKRYSNGFQALSDINLTVGQGEIFALLGPNGAGKTTLISTVCGITKASSGNVRVGGVDIELDYRKARACIGLVPQEISIDIFESVWATVNLSRGLFGRPPNAMLVEKILKDLSLWDKKDAKIMTLSGGMKRRVMIAKALVHEPSILFLDEPTAGVDVELRHDMWAMVEGLRQKGITVVLTTHYIEEAEAMADRIGIINNGKIMLVDTKSNLLERLGKQHLRIDLQQPLKKIPSALASYSLDLSQDGQSLTYHYSSLRDQQDDSVNQLFHDLNKNGIRFCELQSRKSTLEDIFIDLIKEGE